MCMEDARAEGLWPLRIVSVAARHAPSARGAGPQWRGNGLARPVLAGPSRGQEPLTQPAQIGGPGHQRAAQPRLLGRDNVDGQAVADREAGAGRQAKHGRNVEIEAYALCTRLWYNRLSRFRPSAVRQLAMCTGESAMLEIGIKPNIEGLLCNLRREGTPDRAYFIELFLDREVEDAIIARYGLLEGLDPADPHFPWRRQIALYRFLGYECVNYAIPRFVFLRDNVNRAADTAALVRQDGRTWIDEAHGVITSWEDFEDYPWPDARTYDLGDLEWLAGNLPDDMGVAARCHSIFEEVTWLLSYQGLCYALYDQPDLVDAMFNRVGELHLQAAELLVQFPCVRLLFGGDDMGFKTSTMVPARVLIEKSFPWHAKMARLAHERDKLYLLHACGNLTEVMPALLDEVRIDGRHSFEDAIEPVSVAKKRWGDRIALLGGIDMDFICRASEEGVRRRVRETLDACLPGGGYCLGTGNTMANYVPLDNYLAMLDEGRRYAA